MFYGLGKVQTLPGSSRQAAAQAAAIQRANEKIAAAAKRDQAAAQRQAEAQAHQQAAADRRAQAQANTAAQKQFTAEIHAATHDAQLAARQTQQQAAQAQAAARKAEAQAKQAERQGKQAQAQANRQAAAAAKAAQKQATAQSKIDAANAAQQQAQQNAQNFQAMATQFPSPAVVPAGDPGFDSMFAPGSPTPIGANFGTGGPVDYTGDIYGGGVSLPVQPAGVTSPAYPQYPQFAAPQQSPYQPQMAPQYSSGLPTMPSGGGPLFPQADPSMQQPQFDDSAAAYPETQDGGIQLDDGSQVPSQDDSEYAASGVDSGDYAAGVDFSMAGLSGSPSTVNWWLVGGAVLLGWYLLKKKR